MAESAATACEGRQILGLYTGGTLAYETAHMLAPVFGANHPHRILDLGDDEYTVGRPHPMIDGTQRMLRILAESRDPQVAILLLDFILGYGAALDPVGELREAILEAQSNCRKRGGHLTVVASITGTDGDPQDLDLQTRLLRESGVIVFQSNARAAVFCRQLLSAG
jgi:FdrA protein